jgi:hypothetical protein
MTSDPKQARLSGYRFHPERIAGVFVTGNHDHSLPALSITIQLDQLSGR